MRSHRNDKSSPFSPQLEKSPHNSEDPAQPKVNKLLLRNTAATPTQVFWKSSSPWLLLGSWSELPHPLLCVSRKLLLTCAWCLGPGNKRGLAAPGDHMWHILCSSPVVPMAAGASYYRGNQQLSGLLRAHVVGRWWWVSDVTYLPACCHLLNIWHPWHSTETGTTSRAFVIFFFSPLEYVTLRISS